MRFVTLVVRIALSLALTLGTHTAAAQWMYDLPIRNAPVRTIAELPGVRIADLEPSGNPNRFYFTIADSLYTFDVLTKKSARIFVGELGNLDVSPTNDRLVFTRDVEGVNVSNVWIMPLDTKTGLATAPARRLALSPGDQPRISPDGKWVAFAAYDSSDYSATQRVAIISVDGGPERVIARGTGGVGGIEWTPDGRTIYVLAYKRKPGVNYALPSDSRVLIRVPAAGGVVDTVPVRYTIFAPGVSPDGRLIGLTEDGSVGNYVITDLRGTAVSRFSVPVPGQTGWVWQPRWTNAHTLIGSGGRPVFATRIVDLANGTSREIVSAEMHPELLRWSPDGKSIAMFATSRDKRVLLVVDATSGKQREYPNGVVQACCMYDRSVALEWSPDGKAIAFHGAYREPLRVIDLATGAMREVGPKATLIGDFRWRSDSRALQYTATASMRDAHRTIHETTLDGSDRVLFDRLPNSYGVAGMRTDSTAVFNSDSGLFQLNVRTRASTRLRPYLSPWVESNREGTTFVTRDFASNRQQLYVVSAKATEATLKFPFFLPISPPFHPAPLAFLSDGRIFVIARARSQQPTTTPFTAYAVDPKGGEPQRLFDLPNALEHTYIDLSPNGKFLAYNIGPVNSVIEQVDLTAFLPAAQNSKK